MALETARLGTWELELDTGVLECSPLCAAIFGIPPETPITHGELQSIIHPDDRDRRDAAVRKALADGTSYEAEYRVLFPDGSVHWVIGSGRGIYGDDGKPVRMVALTMDVTERKQAEENLHRTNAELRRANEDLNQFAFSASHDLQEPLRTVAIYSQLLRKKYVTRLDSQADGYIENVVQGAQRMEMLLKDLLAYTQIADTAEEPSESIDTAETIRTVLLNLRASIEESGASVQTGNLPYVRVHEIHLLQLFQNLVSNAIKYRSEDPPRICISAVPQGQRWLFSVEDNGLGIDPDHQKLVFGIFKRLHGQRYPGTGIGLAICQRIVERYGGHIWIDSAPGKGSTFHFTLPA
jgi:PAS domain S-box-containing protein